jgi:endo-1,4-beta-xylanase
MEVYMKKNVINQKKVISCLFPGTVLHTCLVICLMFSVFVAYGQMAAGKEKWVGNIWYGGSEPLKFSTYWNQLTPENAGKWASVEGTRDQMNWSQLDAMYNYCKSKGYPFKEHCFVWGAQQPSWIGSLSQSEQKAEVEEWIRLYGERYPDTDSIDVVNEMFHNTPVYKEAIGGNGSTGWDWIVWSFEKARQYCPKAKLLINEYNVIEGYTAVSDYANLANILKSRGLIDGIGVQNHGLESTNLNDVKSRLTQLGNTGLPVYVSEFDLDFGSDENAQKNRYAELFPLMYEHPAVAGITLWGYIQGHHWRENAYILRSDGSERPALTWLREYLSSAPTSGPGEPTPEPTPVQTAGPTTPPSQDPIWNGGPYTLTGSSSSYVDLPDGLTNDLYDFSIACWVKLNTLDTWSRIYDFGGDTNVFMMLTPASGNTGYPYFCITTSGNDGEQGINGTSALPTGSWQHIAVTRSGNTGILYINKQEVGRNTGITLHPADLGNTTNNYIGRSQWSNDPYLNASIENFVVYNRALSASEVSALGSTPPGGGSGTLGDANGDGAINIVDALLIAQYYVGLNPAGFIAENADTNCDGSINIVDALLVAQYYVGLIQSFC